MAGANVSWHHSNPTYFSRDLFNQLTIYQAENTNTALGGSLGIGTSLGPINLSLIEFSFGGTKWTRSNSLYRFKLSPDESQLLTVDQQMNAALDRDLLKRFFEYGDSDPLVKSQKDLSINAEAAGNSANLNFLMLFRFGQKSGHSEVQVKTSGKETRKFRRFYSERTNIVGLNQKIIFDSNITNLKKDSVGIFTEMDEQKPESTMAFLEFWDYSRSLKYDKLISKIDEVNGLFSIDAKTPFYRDYVLPSKTEIAKYKKVYFHTRLYVNGNSILEEVKKLDEKSFETLLKQYYGTQTSSGNNGIDQTGLKQKFKKLKYSQVSDKDYLKYYSQFLKALNIEDCGIGLLQKLAGVDNLFVMGEIYGIYPSFSTLQFATQVAGTRFAGHHWGQYKISPLKAFLHQYAIKHESIYVDGDVQFEDIFGSFGTAQVPYY